MRAEAQDQFSPGFVMHVGIGNVCERGALALVGDGEVSFVKAFELGCCAFSTPFRGRLMVLWVSSSRCMCIMGRLSAKEKMGRRREKNRKDKRRDEG